LIIDSITGKKLKAERCRRSFWEYEKAVLPKQFKDSRPHAKVIADTLQNFIEGKLLKEDGTPYTKMMMNLPPRHLKSLSLVKLCSWFLGKSPKEGIITASYNQKLSGRFSKFVKNDIEMENVDPDSLQYCDIFEARVKFGDASAQLWSLEDSHFSYMGGSPKGTLTGMGCTLGIIDDLVKDAYEARNEIILDGHWDWYTNTWLSRLEEGARQIVNFTRWAERDLCGRLLEEEEGQWYVLKIPVYDGENMLCDEIMSYETYKAKKKLTCPLIFQANFHQETIDDQGSLYKSFLEYTENDLPEGVKMAYIDTADEGKDFLCAIFFIVYMKKIYIYDVVYTQDGQEITEPLIAQKLLDNETDKAMIESNNGGRAFARNVIRIHKDLGGDCVVKWFHQSKNKIARIISNSFWVMENVLYPKGWHLVWPLFYKSLAGFQKEGKNAHDDSADTLTGCAELVTKQKREISIY